MAGFCWPWTWPAQVGRATNAAGTRYLTWRHWGWPRRSQQTVIFLKCCGISTTIWMNVIKSYKIQGKSWLDSIYYSIIFGASNVSYWKSSGLICFGRIKHHQNSEGLGNLGPSMGPFLTLNCPIEVRHTVRIERSIQCQVCWGSWVLLAPRIRDPLAVFDTSYL